MKKRNRQQTITSIEEFVTAALNIQCTNSEQVEENTFAINTMLPTKRTFNETQNYEINTNIQVGKARQVQ